MGRPAHLRWLAAATVALVAAGCSGVPGDPFDAPSRSAATCATPGASRAYADVPTALVPGLSLEVRTDEATRLHASTPVLPGLTALNTAVADEVTEAMHRFRAVPDGGGELNVDWRLAGVSPGTVGVLLQIARRDAGGEHVRTTVRWYDRTTARLVSGAELFTDDGRRELEQRVARDLCTDVPLPPDPTAAFAADGSLLLTLGDEEPTAYVVPAADAAGWLSASGRSARAAAVTPQPLPDLPDPDDVPLGPTVERSVGPTPDASSTATPSRRPDPTPSSAQTSRSPEPSAKPSRSTPKPARSVDCRRLRCVALTFDDGPGAYTAELVRMLEAAKAPATFFMIGGQVDASPTLARRVARGGFEIGSHTYSHPDLTRLSEAELDDQLERTNQALLRATGHRPVLLRPPYGARDTTVDQAAARAGLSEVLWDVDTLDWKHRKASAVRKSVRRQVRRGSIVLMHDIHPTTVEAVPRIVAELRRSGYTLVTVSQLIGRAHPGTRHSRAD